MSAVSVDTRLERFGLWSVFHKHLIVELFTSLRDELGDEYWVEIESEILLVPRPSGPARPVAPDVAVTVIAEHGSALAGSRRQARISNCCSRRAGFSFEQGTLRRTRLA